MGRDVELTLIARKTPTDAVNENGFPVEPEEERKTVFATVKSVGYSEFWKAANAGYQAELKADVYTWEYDGQRLVEIEGRRFKVLRTYVIGHGEKTELTLTDLSEVPSEDTSSGGSEGGGDVGKV